MINNNDLILLLTEMEDKNIHATEAKDYIKKIVGKQSIDLEVLKFINANRQLDVAKFFEKIRSAYNSKKSKLYINIMKELTEENVQDVLTTLSSYLLQVNIFSKGVKDRWMFFKHSRAEEVARMLDNYYKTMDIAPLVKLIALIRCDVKAFNSIK